MKKILLGLVLLSATISGGAQAYYGENSATSKYYSGKISTDEYLDSLDVPSARQTETTVYHSDGSKSLIKSSSYGGTIYHSDGSKSVYNQSPY